MNRFICCLVWLSACGSTSDDDEPDAAGSADAAAVDAAGPTDAASAPDAAPVCVTGTGGFPRPLELPNPEPNGVFDPNFARDPSTGRLWLVYSGVTGPLGESKVSTHLAYSDDDGDTWCYRALINRSEDVPQEQQPVEIASADGHWNHETATIVFDPAAPADERWKLVWHRYLHVDDGDPGTENRHFEHGWIAQRAASSPGGLASAAETKLFSAAAYYATPSIAAYNEAAPGGTPQKAWNTDPTLGSCLAVAEPGPLAVGGELFVAFGCFRTADHEISLVGLNHGTGEWTYRGTLLVPADAQALDPILEGFNAADIVAVAGGTRLLISPSINNLYAGCLVYDLDTASAELADPDDDGFPNPLLFEAATPGLPQSGACAFDSASTLGLVIGDTHASGINFRLNATGKSL